MGKIKRGAFHGFSGKVGNLVGSTWRGESILRLKPEKVNDANSIPQQMQRMKFRLVIQALKPFQTFLKHGFRHHGRTQTAANMAMKANMPSLCQGEFPDFEIDLTRLIIGEGPILPATNAVVTPLTDAQVEVTWLYESEIENMNASDRAMIVMYHETRKQLTFTLDGGQRHVERASVTLPSSWSGETVHAWILFQNIEKNLSGNSDYIGTVTVP